MKQLLLIISILQFVSMNAQESQPGGVEGVIFWSITEADGPATARWKSNMPDDTSSLRLTGKLSSINNNPAVAFNNQPSDNNTTLNIGSLKSFSLFTVCQEKDSVTEQVIFSLENDSLTKTVLTNYRMAALDVYKYYNYLSNNSLCPKIFSYTQNLSDSSGIQSNKLIFGRSPHRGNLPVSVFEGLLPEVIVFNRSLSTKERRRIESYLALKYGISLNQSFPTSYLNSVGEIIWDAEINEMYNSSISGLGRDDASGLIQYVSESSETPGILRVSAGDIFLNNSFLIWGDDNGPLRFEESQGIRKFQRQWKVSAYRNQGKIFNFSSNELAFSEIDPLHEGETYWLMIDQSGTGKYPFGQTHYHKAQSSYKNEKLIVFNPVLVDNDSSGHDVFSLLIAPSFFTKSSVIEPRCFEQNSGAIQTEIVGGAGPYKMLLLGKTNPDFKEFVIESGNHHVFSSLNQGEYALHITDANNMSFTEKIWVSNTTPWGVPLQSTYHLSEGETLYLDASAEMPRGSYYYSWTSPDGISLNSKEAMINQPGNYLLSITDENNCNSLSEITVIQSDNILFRNTKLYPNPVKGRFFLRIELERKADVSIYISNIKGALVIQDQLQNEQYYRYTNVIQQAGIYTITLVGGNATQTLKLIVK